MNVPRCASCGTRSGLSECEFNGSGSIGQVGDGMWLRDQADNFIASEIIALQMPVGSGPEGRNL